MARATWRIIIYFEKEKEMTTHKERMREEQLYKRMAGHEERGHHN